MVFSRRWMLGHVFVIAAVLVLRLGLWQWHRAESPTGGIQNYAYAFQWPLFAAFTLYLYWKTMREEAIRLAGGVVDREARRPMPGEDEAPVLRSSGGVRVGIVTQPATIDEGDDEVALYNRYLAALNAQQPKKSKV